MTQEAALAESVMRHLVEIVSSPDLYSSEDFDAVSKRRIRVARHLQLAAVGALGVMFQMKEMEAICEGEFDGVFVPLGCNSIDRICPKICPKSCLYFRDMSIGRQT